MNAPISALNDRALLRDASYVGGDWMVKYRISAPVAVKAGNQVRRFIRNGPWPGRSSA